MSHRVEVRSDSPFSLHFEGKLFSKKDKGKPLGLRSNPTKATLNPRGTGASASGDRPVLGAPASLATAQAICVHLRPSAVKNLCRFSVCVRLALNRGRLVAMRSRARATIWFKSFIRHLFFAPGTRSGSPFHQDGRSSDHFCDSSGDGSLFIKALRRHSELRDSGLRKTGAFGSGGSGRRLAIRVETANVIASLSSSQRT